MGLIIRMRLMKNTAQNVQCTSLKESHEKKKSKSIFKYLKISYFFRFYVMCFIFFDCKFSRLFIKTNKSYYLINDDKAEVYSLYLDRFFFKLNELSI